jgi:putative component of membrane protein insertase Oxa1/YidC/SpoIIIJ protein YidD
MTCSSYGKAALREFGLFEGLSKLRARLAACAEAAQPIEADPDEGPKPMSEEERKACAQFAGCTCGNFLPIFFLG